MEELIEKLKFHIGNDISEVRNNLASVRDYIKIEELQTDLLQAIITRFANHIKESTSINAVDKVAVLINNPILTKQLIDRVINPIFDLLLETITKRPYDVNMFQVYIVELITNFVFDRKSRLDKLMDSGMMSDFQRRFSTQQDQMLKIYTASGLDAANEFVTPFLAGQFPLITDSKFPQCFALTLSQTSSYHIKEFLQSQKPYFGEDYLDFLSIILMNEKEFLSNAQIQIVEKYIKSESLNWKEDDSLGDVDSREIKIKKEYLPYIAGKLKPYFSEEDYPSLLIILEGKSIKPKRIVFNETGAMLGYFFRELKEKEDVIESKKIAIQKWMANYIDFKNQSTKTITPFTFNMAHQYVSSKTKLKGKNTINISDFEEFDKKATKTK